MPRPRIRTLLVANRGEIACRVQRTARAMGITTVAVYADPDADAPHVRGADRAVALGGTTGAETYLDVAKVLDAARRTGADAVHPGYGFLSENAAFAEAVVAAGLTWVGPPPAAIRAMGDKLTALARMTEAGVPTLPRAEVAAGDPDAAATAAQRVGYPLMVKASAGGGGKGMRVVAGPDELRQALAGAQREAAGAFGDDTVFLERFVEHGRHIEVQVFADQHGTVRSLFERECSIQRRHQKVVEEAPSPFVDPALREEMGQAAVAAAAAVGYVGAGTVEFIVADDRSFSFLEMNTRLQVEHPVTELVTGLDLVRLQLEVAEGRPLVLDDLALRGWAIEARLYAEDPAADFLPQSGRLVRWLEPDSVRVDAGVAEGGEVSPYFDPLLAKVVAQGRDREEAAARLARALRALRVHGVRTNRDLLVAVLEDEAYLAGDTTIDFITRVDPARSRAVPPVERRRALLAAGLADRAAALRDRNGRDGIPAGLPAGWRNVRTAGERYRYRVDGDEVDLAYRELPDGTVQATVGDVPVVARVHGWDDPWLDLEVDGVRERVTVTADPAGDRVWVHGVDGEVALAVHPRFPVAAAEVPTGGLTAPMNGTVASVEVAIGDRVAAGQALLVLEAMKMEHRVLAPVDGVVRELRAAVGASVAADDVLAVVEEPAGDADGGDRHG